MDTLWLILSGVGMGLVAAIPIGPVNIICIRRTFTFGPVNGFASGMGGVLGDGIFATISAFGLTWAAQLIQGYAVWIELVGGVMMLFFGWHAIKAGLPPDRMAEENPPETDKSRDGGNLFKAIASTFALTITNPATLLFFTGMFARVGSLAGSSGDFADARLIVVGVMLGSAAWWLILTTVIGLFHARIDGDRVLTINRVCGFLVAAFGLAVLGNLLWGLMSGTR
jgi:threonine/homoserine/homoserine lactone efflux protein